MKFGLLRQSFFGENIFLLLIKIFITNFQKIFKYSEFYVIINLYL